MNEDRPVTKEEVDASNNELVNTIILWRIYDVLLLLLAEQSGHEIAGSVSAAHEAGRFIGPNPSFSGVDEDG